MKKILFGFMLVLSSLFIFSSIKAAGTGNLVVHFQKFDSDYEKVGRNVWGAGADYNVAKGPLKLAEEGLTKTDDFGIYYEFNNIVIEESGSLGIQFIGFIIDGEVETINWNAKIANFEIPYSELKSGKTVHIYTFEGGNNRTNNEAYPEEIGKVNYLVADPEKQGIIVAYLDPDGEYEAELGMHTSNFETNSGVWGTPLKTFENVGLTSDKVYLKAAILYYIDLVVKPTALIYVGDTKTKISNDMFPNHQERSGTKTYIENKKDKGQLDVYYVLKKGYNPTSTDFSNIFLNDPKGFQDDAFSFKFIKYQAAATANAEATGTYAFNKKTLFAKTNQPINNLYVTAENETDKELADAKIKSFFKVKEITSALDATELTFGDEIEIESIDYSKSTANIKISDFVLILKNELDNKKRYMLFYDNLEENANNVKTQIELNLDKEKPVITFISPQEIVGKAEAERIIEIEFNKKFDQNKFPVYTAKDDRDGTITRKVFVPSGNFSKLDTNKKGDYVIMLEVSDKWGNVTQEKFTFRVK